MNLTFEQIRSITLGAVSIREQENGLRFNRFTDEQLALYDGITEGYQLDFKNRARFTAGIKLSFRTDSPRLYLRVFTSKITLVRRFFSVDVTVDGEYLDSLDNFSHKPLAEDYLNDAYELGVHEKQFDLGKGCKHVEIWFPWSVSCQLQELQLEDGASLEPVRPAKKLLVFGDSITQGFDTLRPSKRPLAKVAEMLGAEEVCKAIGGERFFPALAERKDSFVPDYIYVAYGTNDWGVGTREALIPNSKAFYAALRRGYPGVPIFAVTPIWRADHHLEKPIGPFEIVEQSICDAVASLDHVHQIRGFDFVPHDTMLYSDRRLHPNDAGFLHYTENLLKQIRELPL